jgi:hypothetical protein
VYKNPAEKEKKKMSINHTATISINYITDYLSAQLYLPLVCPLLYNRNQSDDALRV